MQLILQLFGLHGLWLFTGIFENVVRHEASNTIIELETDFIQTDISIHRDKSKAAKIVWTVFVVYTESETC